MLKGLKGRKILDGSTFEVCEAVTAPGFNLDKKY